MNQFFYTMFSCIQTRNAAVSSQSSYCILFLLGHNTQYNINAQYNIIAFKSFIKQDNVR